MTALSVVAEIEIPGAPLRVAVQGRNAWALLQLARAGDNGCTPFDHPGPRWSAYAFNLRRLGVPVETVTELHGGQFRGHHARYRLGAPVRLIRVDGAEGGAA